MAAESGPSGQEGNPLVEEPGGCPQKQEGWTEWHC